MGDGPTVRKLKDIIYPRALSRRFEVEQRVVGYVVRNSDEKIVCHAEILELEMNRQKREKISSVVFYPLKGYDQEKKEIEDFARKSIGNDARRAVAGSSRDEGWVTQAPAAGERTDPISLLLAGERDNPLCFLSHKALCLEKGLPLPDASCRLLLQFAQVMESCIPGIIADIDSEFLHDFRVCVRKSRAFLSLLKEQLCDDTISTHRDFLRECGGKTTPMRDLDVYLLEFPRFYNLLPPTLSTYLKAFYDEIWAKRSNAQSNLYDYLCGSEYRRAFASWKEFLGTPDMFTPVAGTDSARLGRRLIAGKYRKVRKLATRISAHTSDTDLHILRIECKKLRYCIEFFKEAVGEQVVGDVLSSLKTLQDVLGEFNDMSVQQAWLHDAVNSQEVIRGPGVHAAIGGLMTSLYARQQNSRKQVFDEFNRFVDEKIAEKIIELKKG